MFKPGTVLVVGAGASSEFNLPLGAGLAANIARNLAVVAGRGGFRPHLADSLAYDLTRRRYRDDKLRWDDAWAAAKTIREGILHAQSIDAFIDMHHEKLMIATFGKLQIALEILRAEGSSTLAVDRSNINNRIDFRREQNAQSWLRVLAEILLEKAKASDLASIGKELTIITFNYDRCIQHYLIEALSATLAIEYVVARQVVSQMKIIHPYGKLGDLPSARGGSGDGVAFGADPGDIGDSVWEIADGLSTFTEEMRDAGTLAEIHGAMAQATQLVFLGFGFQSQNVQLLTPKGQSNTARVMTGMATGYGLHQIAVPEIRNRIQKMLWGATYDVGREAIMLGVGCGEFMRANRLVLGAS